MKDLDRERLLRILEVLGIGVVVTGAIVVPNLLVALAPVLGAKANMKRRHAYHLARYARQRRWIGIRETQGGLEYFLTEKGHSRWQTLQLTQPLKTEKWDRKWRVVIFDIPDRLKKVRDHLRWVLRQAGFTQLQESVWLTPWECLHYLDVVRNLFGIGLYVRLITATHIEGEDALLRKFHLEP